MPRARKTQSGKPAMSVNQIPGQQYGKGVEQTRLQQAMPAPRDQTAAVAARAARASAQPATPPMQGRGSPAPADAMEAARALRERVGLLPRPTQRPAEPVTAGLSSGPGAGPEVLGMAFRSPLGEMMRSIARQSGDPFLADLADRANL